MHAYESYAKLPLEDVAISVFSTDGTAIALRITNRSGLIIPIEIPVPDRSESLFPDPPEQPYTLVNLCAHLKGYEQIKSDNLQIFADTVTNQDLMMIPLAEHPESWNKIIQYNTPPQNL